MAEITSGKNLTIIVLDEFEARLLADHLSPHPTFEHARDQRHALVAELAEALAGVSG
tara:strand:+ start:198 stop:368 length:171 start_codon:yes stop_codon:yes gene_type:complete